MSLHFYRYSNNWAVGIDLERTFVGYWALRFGLLCWCFSITWKAK